MPMRDLLVAAGLGLLASGAGAATLDFDTIGDCSGGDIVTFNILTDGSACKLWHDSPDAEDDAGAVFGRPPTVEPGPTAVRATFSAPVYFVSVFLGDFGEDADNIFLRIFDGADKLLDSVEYLRAAGSLEMIQLSLKNETAIAYAEFGTNAEDLGAFFADDFSYSTTAPIPLPASLPLLLAGVGGLALLRRRARG